MRRLLLLGALLGAAPLHAQSLASRVAGAGDGAVTFEFAARPGVCGDGESFVQIGHSFIGHFSGDGMRGRCTRGPVQVRLERQGGEVTRVRWWAGVPRDRPESRDLGVVPAREAADYLLSLAARGAGRAAEDAITPAVLADSVTVWPTLLTIARDRESRRRSARQQAAHWLGRLAQAKLLGHPNDLSVERDESEDTDLKRHAVFVMSQRPRDEGVPSLLQVARTNRDPAVRGQALFWLGQSGDERALALFEEILRRD